MENRYLDVTTHAGIARQMARTLSSYGLDARAMFAAAGLDPDASQTPDTRVAAAALQQVWRDAVTQSGDEAFGLTYAEHMQPTVLEGLGFAWLASSTLRDAIERLVRYYRFIVTAGAVALEEDGDELRLFYRTPGSPGTAAPASIDAALAIFVQLCRITKDDQFRPIRATMQRQEPADVRRFEEFFACPIEFGAQENSLVFNASQLDEPLPTGNPELARANDQVVIEYLSRHDQDDIVGQVRAAIIEWLPSGAPSQERIAASMHMSSRTLQRRLSVRDLSYKTLLDEVRNDIAQQYLRGSTRSVSEIAYLLGFSEPGNFTRSFKRWTGMNPQEFQAQG